MMKNTLNAQEYTIILVDDEEEVRRRIISKFPQDSGFRIIGEANNGYDAIELIERLKPDVVISDIRMPYVDGIQLATQIRRDYPQIKIAFISSYDEFSYAKEAIKLDVVSYLSKPIADEEIFQLLEKLKQRLDEEYQTLFNHERLNSIYQENINSLIENQFNRLLHYSNLSDQDIERFEIFDIDLKKGVFAVCMLDFDNHADFLELEYLRIFLLNLFKKKFTDSHIYSMNTSYGLIVIVHEDALELRHLETTFLDILQTKNQFSKIHVQMGVSELFADFKEFPQHVQEARNALSASNTLNIGPVIYYRDIASKKRIDLKLSKDEMEEISYIIKFGTEEDIQALFGRLKQNTEHLQGYLLDKQSYLVNLSHILLEFANSVNVELNGLLNEISLFDTLSQFHQLDEMFDFIRELVLEIRELNTQKSQTSSHQVLAEAISYLQNNYSNPLISMDLVCDILGISISYLSALFKKMMDTSFNKYLVKLRMEKAQELLKYSAHKVYEIATLVGYNDVYYFSYSFKKYTGQSPKEYRHDQKAE